MISQQQVFDRLASFLEEGAIIQDKVRRDSNLYESYSGQESAEFLPFDGWIAQIHEQFGLRFDAELFDCLPPAVAPEPRHRKLTCALTCGQLAERLWRQLPQVSFEPVNVAGRDCGPAGAFFGLVELSRHVKPTIAKFRPSTQVLDRLQGRDLRRFWTQLQVQAGVSFREPDDVWSNVTTIFSISCIALGIAILVGISILGTGLFDLLMFRLMIFWLLSVPVTIAVCATSFVFGPYYLRLPSGIRTFRDLSEYISKHLPAESGGVSRVI